MRPRESNKEKVTRGSVECVMKCPLRLRESQNEKENASCNVCLQPAYPEHLLAPHSPTCMCMLTEAATHWYSVTLHVWRPDPTRPCGEVASGSEVISCVGQDVPWLVCDYLSSGEMGECMREGVRGFVCP